MTELFLHYIWQYQKFDSKDLNTIDGKPLKILSAGLHNDNSGPDFYDSRIMLDGLQWIGKIELHHRSSDWIIHNHQEDPNYDNVILHVVWQHDRDIRFQNGEFIPTLELKNRISQDLLIRSRSLTHSPREIPCESRLHEIDPVVKSSMISRTLLERVEEKSELCHHILSESSGDWNFTSFVVLAKAFGVPLNHDIFSDLARKIPLNEIRKYIGNEKAISSMVFGLAGFLDDESRDDYHSSLITEFQYLKSKHRLKSELERFEWKFHRMRPSNFPTIRLGQLSRLMTSSVDFHGWICNESNLSELINKFKGLTPQYWRDHYDFGKHTPKSKYSLGVTSIKGIIINAIIPILVASSRYFDKQEYMENAIRFLEGLSPENNRITRIMKQSGFTNNNSFESQGLIQLYKNYCTKKRCLACNIGVSLLKA